MIYYENGIPRQATPEEEKADAEKAKEFEQSAEDSYSVRLRALEAKLAALEILAGQEG